MPLNPDAVGTTGDPVECSWTSKDALLYAVSIGAGVDELEFTTENTNGVTQRVFPTIPVVLAWGRGSAMRNIGTFNPALLVHGQQAVTLHPPDPGRGLGHDHQHAHGHVRQGQGGRRRHRDHGRDRRGAALPNRSSAFIRGEGGWGGDRDRPVPERAARRGRPTTR